VADLDRLYRQSKDIREKRIKLQEEALRHAGFSQRRLYIPSSSKNKTYCELSPKKYYVTVLTAWLSIVLNIFYVQL
jgi:hypothetical protein